MALNNYSTDGFLFNVNGRVITDWGESDPPYSDAPIDPKSTLRRGLGGNAIRLDRKNPGREITINLNPGSPDSAFLQGLFVSGANVTVGYAQTDTLEGAIGSEGVVVNDGEVGRGGATITDDQYIIQCNVWTQTKGGTE